MNTSVLYVANLPFDTQEGEMRKAFSGYGKVIRVSMVRDRSNGSFKGFCFVEMSTVEAAEKALELNRGEFGGRAIVVKPADPPKPKKRSFHVRNNRRDSKREAPVLVE